MIETGFLLAKIAIRKFFTGTYRPYDIMRLVDQLVSDYQQLGKLNPNASYAPVLDQSTLEVLEKRQLRKTLETAFTNTKYYSRLAKMRGVVDLRPEKLSSLPVTTKKDLRGNESEFIDLQSKGPVMLFSSTGTTGSPPTYVWMGRTEMELVAASRAFSIISRGLVLPHDIVQFAFTSRAALTTWANIEACKRVGAAIVHTGLITPDECLRFLNTDFVLEGKSGKVTVIYSYPSYLELLVENAKTLGYSSGDFGLKRIVTAGEVFTRGAAKKVREFFGADLSEVYNISECIQMSGSVCSQGNLHFPRDGRVEVLEPETLEEVSEQESGLLTLTPYKPPREVTLLVRYVTGDLLKKIGKCNCEFAFLPAYSRPLGKYHVELARYGLTYRDLFELLEEVDGVSHPLRISFVHEEMGKPVLHIAVENDAGVTRSISELFARKGLPQPQVILHGSREPFHHYPVRCDLQEETFSHLERQQKG